MDKRDKMVQKKNRGWNQTRLMASLAAAASVCVLIGMPFAVMAEEVRPAGPGVGLPADYSSPYVPPEPVGPGVVSETPGTLPDLPVYNRIDYFTEQVPNPIVHPSDKYTYDQMEQDITSLSRAYPNRLQVNVIGNSLDGRNIYELVLGNPEASRHILIHGGMHAREYMTPLLLMKQIEYGLYFYDRGTYGDRALNDLLWQTAIHYIPMVNPDGIALSQFGTGALRSEQLRQQVLDCYAADTASGRTSEQLERYLMLWKANARGVDLNQNFPANWELVTTAAHPSYATFKGEAPLSEPESQALANLTLSRSWAVTISYHSMGNILYWDYEGNKKRDESNELANRIANNTGYQLYGSSGHGGYKDWAQIMENPVPGLTLETGSVACPMPLEEFDKVWDANKMVWAEAAEYAIEYSN